jgi:histidyl-tRNA synthetase
VRGLSAAGGDESAAGSGLQSSRRSADHRKTAAHQRNFSKKTAASILSRCRKILKAVGVEFQINDRLVRGLDYYTRTAFEFTHGALGAQNAILGGGRYDGLSESIGGPPAPGIGFAIGEDRLVMTLQETMGSCSRSRMCM